MQARVRKSTLRIAVASLAPALIFGGCTGGPGIEASATPDSGSGPTPPCVGASCTDSGQGEPDGGSAAGDPVWGCLDQMSTPPPLEEDRVIRRAWRFVDILAGSPLSAVQIRACANTDTVCANPREGTAQSTDADGEVTLTLNTGFRGYLDIPRPDAIEDLFPAIVPIVPIPNADAPAIGTVEFPLLREPQAQYIAATAGKSIHPSSGHLLFRAVDCQQSAAAGVSVHSESVTSETWAFYADGAGTPSLTRATTTASGMGGIFNLPPGSVTVTMARETGQALAAQSVLVRAGTITYLSFGPMP